MNDLSKPLLSIDLSDGAHFNFQNIEEISAWLEREQSAFRWLAEGGAQAGEGVANLRQSHLSTMKDMRAQLNRWREAPENETFREKFANSFRNSYSSPTSVRSDHQFTRIAADIAAKDGPIAGSAAFGFLLGVESQISFHTVKGIIEATLKRSGIEPKSPNIVSSTIADLNSAASTDRARIVAEWSAIADEVRAFLQNSDTTFKTQNEHFDERSAEILAGINESANAAIKSIQATESAYNEQMKLQASVEYWNAKATVHKTALWWSRLTLTAFAIGGSAFLIAALLSIATTAIEFSERHKGDAAIFIKYAAIGAVVTTIVFWVGRVLLRIYLSDRHLLTDAEERIAMVKTYLALTREGKLEPTDRALILAPLFRSAADGIVKDDGPDASLAGVIAKALDVRGGR